MAPFLPLQKLKGVDFFRDLTEATLAGASISLLTALAILLLFFMELGSFLQTDTRAQLVVDRSPQGDLLRINFNVSFPSLPCEFASLDVSDALGTKRLNLTKTVRKLPIHANLERGGFYQHDDLSALDVKYDDYKDTPDLPAEDYSLGLTAETFEPTLKKYPVVAVNFYAPWCPWCQRLAPTWEAATQELHTKYPEADGRIRFAKARSDWRPLGRLFGALAESFCQQGIPVDCVQQPALCRTHHITGFPSIRIFRGGHDEITVHGMRDHEAYHGNRGKADLLAFGDTLAESAGRPHSYIKGVMRMAKTSGCAMSGFVLVKKVPGTLHFLAKSSAHSFAHDAMNMSHVVNYWYVGNKPSPFRRKMLEKLHPAGLTNDWADKLSGKSFFSHNAKATFEHYLQIMLTTVNPARHRRENTYDAYEYTVHSHTYNTHDIPSAKFSYDLSPIQIIVSEQTRHWYHFVTTTSAIVGGVFTVAGILDGLVHTGARMAQKVDLGKQG